MPIYMKIDGVDGDVTAEKHEKWISLHSVQWGSSRSVSTSGEVAHRTKSAVHVAEVVVTKDRDSSSGKLWRENLLPEGKTVQIDWVTQSQGGDAIYQTLKLTNGMVSAYSQSSHADGKPLEQISLNFTEIELTAYELPKEGVKPAKPFVQSYNLSKG
jgi:type VI secretion system secreted protein Hcp